ncbi:hypothetical protein [Algoriphagus sp.]|uniref:hypothetical protein n=1 Tax=Algoriphagus sp. TaxID=1872435 RepID=UPI003276590E
MKLIRNRSFIALLLLGMLSMNLDLSCQIQKIPFLLSHFEDHQTLHGDSVLEFVVEDYIDHGSDNKSHDEENHDNLPFHGNTHCCYPSVFYASNENFQLMLFEFASQYEFGFYAPSFSSEYLDMPFQPPKA